jgi:CheY-like chemotaxis protein
MKGDGAEGRGEKRKTILVVEDDPEFRALLFDILKSLGYQSIAAANGIEALETLSRNKVDLIIADVRMPRMNGIDCLKP